MRCCPVWWRMLVKPSIGTLVVLRFCMNYWVHRGCAPSWRYNLTQQVRTGTDASLKCEDVTSFPAFSPQIYECLMAFQRLTPSPLLPYASGLSLEVYTHTYTQSHLYNCVTFLSFASVSFCISVSLFVHQIMTLLQKSHRPSAEARELCSLLSSTHIQVCIFIKYTSQTLHVMLCHNTCYLSIRRSYHLTTA